jgi:hypothetical protein
MNSGQVLKTYVQSSLETGLLNPSEAVNATHEAVADYYSQRLTPPFCIPFSEPDPCRFTREAFPQIKINVSEVYRRQCEAYVRQLVRTELERFKDEQGHVDVPHLLDRVIRLEQELGTCDPMNKLKILESEVANNYQILDEQINGRKPIPGLPELDEPGLRSDLQRLTNHVNRELGVTGEADSLKVRVTKLEDHKEETYGPLEVNLFATAKRVTDLKARFDNQVGPVIELPAVCDRLNRLEQNHNNFAQYMGRELQRLETHFQDLIQMLIKKFTRRIRRRKEK